MQVSPSYLLTPPSAPSGASLDPGLPFILTLGLPWGADWVPGAAGCPRGPCGLCPSGLGGPQWAAPAAPATGLGAEPLWSPAGLP